MNSTLLRIVPLGRLCLFNNVRNSVSKSVYSFRYSQHASERVPFKEPVYDIVPQPKYTASKQDRDQYNSVFSTIVKDLTEPYKDIPTVQNYLIKLLNATIPNHKQASGQAVVSAYKAFALPEDITPENIHLACVLGWCCDLAVASVQIADDIMDKSEIRCGLPCWYKNDDVGLAAINDALIVECEIYVLLKKYLSKHEIYLNTLEWFHEVILRTALGQLSDIKPVINRSQLLSSFTMERWRFTCEGKAVWPELFMPVFLGMNLASINDADLRKQVKSVLMELGYYLEAQNHILDCYGDPLILGKIGTDISEGKCTWLVLRAMEKANPEQRDILEQHYGRPNSENVLEIKRLYKDLNIFEDFLDYENSSYNQLCRQIKEMPKKFPKDFFLKLVDTIYGRSGYTPTPY